MLLNIIEKHEVFIFFFLNIFPALFMAKQANILLFGGNGFIGSECVRHLLKDGHKLTVVNRGNNYWDYNTEIKPHVHEIQCDRMKGLQSCSDFSSKFLEPFDFVVDFSAFEPKVIQDALENLKGKIGTYIYISSDSVYEVSKEIKSRRAKEVDAIRPDNLDEQNNLNKKDSYGHNKLAGEELLQEKCESLGISYVIFRLPDVIGPRDNTLRWWTYQAWMQLYSSSDKPLTLPRDVESLTTSYVYVKDVANIIRKTIMEIKNRNKATLGEIFNLGFPEEYSLKKVLDSMQEALKVRGIVYHYDKKAYHAWLPSVTRGPVNISKAVDKLQWTTTPWNRAVQETVEFFTEAWNRFPHERYAVLMKISSLVDEDFDSVQSRAKSYTNTNFAGSKKESHPLPESHEEL